MKKVIGTILIIILILIFLSVLSSELGAQGISRSTGIGLRMSFWNVTNQPSRIQISGLNEDAEFNISGLGTSLYFFSRMYHNWFLEFSLGGIGAVNGKANQFDEGNVEASTLVPLLFGVRYDVLSSRLTSSMQPYLTAGIGPYWGTEITVEGNLNEQESTFESSLNYGNYLGAGMNITLSSWFALNFDFRYHLVDFKRDHQYSGLEFGLGFSFMWGRQREIFEIKETRLVVSDIYPAYYQFYNTYPLALVSVKNLAGYPIEVNVRCFVAGYSEKPKDSGFIQIAAGKTEDIPVTAFFSPQLKLSETREAAILDLDIEARAGATYRKQVSSQIMVHHRNAWNGDVDKLAFFVTPDDPVVLQVSRRIAETLSEKERATPGSFHLARRLFQQLKEMGIRYHRDPNIPYYQDDRVQFAVETREIKLGDCDDLVVLYSSLLESAGIKTAFVDVRDPEKEIAHLYLMFDSGLAPDQGYLLSSNDKRFVVRENNSGKKTLWIPVETTLLEEGFEKAWLTGASAYLQEGILRGGLVADWVRLSDVK